MESVPSILYQTLCEYLHVCSCNIGGVSLTLHVACDTVRVLLLHKLREGQVHEK
jgi:hypothetical protein